jgi:Uma2 family endonuclease
MQGASPLENRQYFTYGEYLQWDDTQRWELIHGEAYNMTPAPSRKHQKILVELTWHFENFLRDKPYELYVAPFDVRLPEKDEADEQINSVVQPDLSVICDKTKLDDRGCRGAPDLIIEIVSPSTGRKDMKDKLFLYEHHGVKEYWVLHPEEKVLMRFKLEKQGDTFRYGRPDVYDPEDSVETPILQGLTLDLGAVFEAIRQ